jgi:hypothetical protein
MKPILLMVMLGVLTSPLARAESGPTATATISPTSAPATSASTATTYCDGNAFLWGGEIGSGNHTASKFEYTGSMAMPRAGHTATLLTDGTVLVINGGQLDIDDLLVSVTSAEIFDPYMGTFTGVGAPCITREFHTATLLTNGKVLITGGNEFNGYPTWLTPTSTAELYDPVTGSFAMTGSMAVGRSGHTASLLNDGRVLIVGGGPPTAEIYDPVTGAFSVVPGLIGELWGHTATVLTSSKVLIVSQAGSKVYDPETNFFTSIGSMNEPRVFPTATLLPNGTVLVVGGVGRNGILQSAELFDPLTASFVPTAPMATGRLAHTATLLPDGTVLISGGIIDWNNGYHSYSSAEIFDPATASFTTTGPMNTGRFWHTATLLPDGTVMVTGGVAGDDLPQSSAEIYK